MSRAVFLDRDGVLVRELVIDGVARAPLRLSDFAIAPEAPEQVRRLQAAGFRCIVFTNQPEVSLGLLPMALLDTMHAQLREATGVDAIEVCPHVDADGCTCRKPLPGMLLSSAHDADVRLEESFVVGDRWRDIDAGRAVGCYSILIERPYSACHIADARVENLTQAVDLILTRLNVAEGDWVGAAGLGALRSSPEDSPLAASTEPSLPRPPSAELESPDP